MESGKRPIPTNIYIKLLNRLGIGVNDSRNSDVFQILPEAALELVNALRFEGEFRGSLIAGQNFLKNIHSQSVEFEVSVIRLRGSLMNSALDLGDFDLAREILGLEFPASTPQALAYSYWSLADYSEVTGDVQSAMDFYRRAFEIASTSLEPLLCADLRQGYINSKLQLSIEVDDLEGKFLQHLVEQYSHSGDHTRLALARLTLAWAHYRQHQIARTLKELALLEENLLQIDSRVCGSIAESIADLCTNLENRVIARKLLSAIAERVENTDADQVKKLIWTRLRNAGKKTRDDDLLKRCDYALSRISA
jgi:hypothetical protein